MRAILCSASAMSLSVRCWEAGLRGAMRREQCGIRDDGSTTDEISTRATRGGRGHCASRGVDATRRVRRAVGGPLGRRCIAPEPGIAPGRGRDPRHCSRSCGAGRILVGTDPAQQPRGHRADRRARAGRRDTRPWSDIWIGRRIASCREAADNPAELGGAARAGSACTGTERDRIGQPSLHGAAATGNTGRQLAAAHADAARQRGVRRRPVQ